MAVLYPNKTKVPFDEIMQNAVLRATTSNTLQRKSKQQLITEHEKLESYKDKNEYVIHSICRQDESAPNLQIQIENRISIANLQVDHVFTGKFLLCRVVTRCTKMSALLTLVEDPEGNVERLFLYNCLQPATKKDHPNLLSINQFLPVATHLVIKNPSYKVAGDGNTIIRSDDPKDVIVINHNNKLFSSLRWPTDEEFMDKMIKSADDYRRCGNDYFASNDYIAAIDEYSGGIKLEPQNATLLANRAEVYLRLQQFRRAFADVEVALKHEPSHLKAAYRKGKALCGLKRYQEAIITLKDLHQRIKVNTDHDIISIIQIKLSTEQLLKHAEMLAFENKNGQYDYIRIIDEFYEKAKIRKDSESWVNEAGPRLDHADFLIDDIEIRPVEGKGRGWIAKCDIPKNTLLMATKAFRIVYSNEVSPSKAGTDIDVPDESVCATELLTRIGQSLIEEPDYRQELYRLYSGQNSGELDHSVNMRRIADIIIFNGFTLQYNTDIFNSKRLNELPGVGLWISPSYFNHSCVDYNVNRIFIGDLMFIRSLRHISKGEELIISYTSFTFSHERRSRYLKSVDIDCQCRLCKLEISEAQETKFRRAQLLETYEKSIDPRILHDADPFLIKVLVEIIAELRSLRKEHPELEFHSLKLRRSLAYYYYLHGDPNQSFSILKEAYDYWKTVPHDLPDVQGIILDISLVYNELRQKKKANKWFDMALKALVEPVRGKIKDDETKWRVEALDLAERLEPNKIFTTMNAMIQRI